MIRAYLRVSTRKQASEGNGLDAQEISIRNFCAYSFPDKSIVFYKDDGVSGTVPFEERPEGMKLLNDLNNDDLVVTKDPSRFGRRCIISIGLLNKIEQMGGIVATSLSGNIVKDADSKFMFHLFSALAEKDYEMLVSNMEEGKKVKAKKGGNTGGGIPFYLIKSHKKGEHYEPTETGIEKLSKMIEMFDTGMSGKEMARLLEFSPSTISKYRKLYKSGDLENDLIKYGQQTKKRGQVK